MRKIVVLVLLMFIISPVDGLRHVAYSKAKFSDEGIYLYFSDVIRDAEKCLDDFLNENPNTLNFSINLYKRVNLIESESRFYSIRGFRSNVTRVVNPFLSLAEGIENLAQSQHIFLKYIYIIKNNYSAYVIVRSALTKMEVSADKINKSIYKIEKIELWNETSKIRFDVSNLKSKLKDVYDLISYYRSLLAKFEIEGLVVTVSDDHPFLYQEIQILVYAKNVTQISLFIDSVEYKVNNSIMKYSFKRLGEHVIYAKGINYKGKIVKSNVVKVYVSKIPTRIILSSDKSTAFLNERVKVSGYLLDYYGKPLNANVTVKVDNAKFNFKGFFEFNVTRRSEGFLKIFAFYHGNETYRSSNASLSIFFSKFPVFIYIEPNKKRVRVNETIEFKGRIYGANYSIPVHIFVNSTDVGIINVKGDFNFTTNFSKPGRYSVFVKFFGDQMHKPSESNKVEIFVESRMSLISSKGWMLPLVITVVAVFILIFIYIANIKKFSLKKVKDRSTIHEKLDSIELERVTKELKIPEDIEEAYNLLFKTLTEKYNLKKSLTPRELFKALSNEDFAEKLKIITELHEKAVYSGKKLEDDEKEMYLRLITEILKEYT